MVGEPATWKTVESRNNLPPNTSWLPACHVEAAPKNRGRQEPTRKANWKKAKEERAPICGPLKFSTSGFEGISVPRVFHYFGKIRKLDSSLGVISHNPISVRTLEPTEKATTSTMPTNKYSKKPTVIVPQHSRFPDIRKYVDSMLSISQHIVIRKH